MNFVTFRKIIFCYKKTCTRAYFKGLKFTKISCIFHKIVKTFFLTHPVFEKFHSLHIASVMQNISVIQRKCSSIDILKLLLTLIYKLRICKHLWGKALWAYALNNTTSSFKHIKCGWSLRGLWVMFKWLIFRLYMISVYQYNILFDNRLLLRCGGVFSSNLCWIFIFVVFLVNICKKPVTMLADTYAWSESPPQSNLSASE